MNVRGLLHSVGARNEPSRRRWFLGLLCWMLFASTLCIFGEQRFPPPEFESGYALPATQTPLPRSIPFEYLDVAVLAAALGLACFFSLKKRSRAGIVGLSIFSLFYFGFYRKGCVCSIGSLQNVALGLVDPRYSVPVSVAAFFVLPLAVSLFAGRAFCAGVCPHGALQDLLLLRPVKVPRWLEQGLNILPFIYLGAGIWFAATGTAFIICQYDPIVPIFRMSGSFFLLMVAAVFFVGSMFVGRPYCRFLCPYGALLKLGASVSKWRVRVTPNVCTQCRLCEDSCPHGALREPVLSSQSSLRMLGGSMRWGWFLILVPALILFAGWAGSKFGRVASQVHPTVAIAERMLVADEATPVIASPSRTAESLALRRAKEDSQEVLRAAIEIRGRFVAGGWLLGGWIGIVLAAKWILLSIRANRVDFEPDRGACFSCARCFDYCPNELVRRGLSPAALAAPVAGSLFEGTSQAHSEGRISSKC